MPSLPFTSRLQGAGAALRTARPTWGAPRPAGTAATRRLALLVLVGIIGVVAVVYLILRLTPLSTVQRVTVIGAQGPDQARIRHEIERASLGQSTLGFGDGAIRRAVADTTSITGITVHTKFPHAVQVEVHQRLAIGAAEVDGKRVAVATDGKLLPDWAVGDLPLIRGARTANGVVVGGGRDAATVLAAAPRELLARVARVDGGTTVRIADGPALLFRNTDRVNAKWLAAVAVLSDPGTAGATWIDLRVPDQPVAGKGAPPTLPSRTAKVGRVTASDDALATAEGRAADPEAPSGATATGGASADPTTSTAPAVQQAAAPVGQAATGTGTGTGAPPETGGTPTAATSTTPDSGATSPPAGTATGAGTGGATGVSAP